MNKKILIFLLFSICLFSHNSISFDKNIQDSSHLKTDYSHHIRRAFSENRLLQADEYCYDTVSFQADDFPAIEQEVLSESSNNEIYYSEDDLPDNKEIVKCNYSTFKEVVYLSNKSKQEIYNELIAIEDNSINNLNNNENNGDNYSPCALTPDINIEDSGPGGGPSRIVNVLTSGAGGDASGWSNEGEEEYEYVEPSFYLNDNSLAYKIAHKYNSNVIIGNFINNDNDQILCRYYEIEPESYKNDRYNYLENSAVSINALNLTNNDVLIFNFDDYAVNSHQHVYDRFETMLTECKNKFPDIKFNLIGHSRGGLINAMYAAEYPFNVNEIFSIGTPYYPPLTAEIASTINALPNWEMFQMFKEAIGAFEGNNQQGYTDMASDSTATQIRQNLNSALSSNSLMDMTVYGVYTQLIVRFIIDFGFFAIEIHITYDLYTDGLVDIYNALGYFSEFTIISSGTSGFLAMIEKVEALYNPLSSNVNREIIKISLDQILEANADEKSVPGQIAIPHNLETQNPEFHNSILSKI